MVSRGRGSHKVEDLTGKEATIYKTELSVASPKDRPHYLCHWRVVSPYVGISMTFSVRSDDEMQAYVKGRQTLAKRGARVV